MRPVRLWLGLLGTLAAASLPAPAGAQPVGDEFQINTYTTSKQLLHNVGGRRSVASDPSGNFVVVWQSLQQDGSGYGIFGQRYDSAGNALGTEFRVNSYRTSDQELASVASDAGGNFVVVWNSDAQDGSQNGVFGQRFDGAGNTLGSEFRVNSYTSGPQQNPAVAFDASGNFIVVWQSNDQDGDKSGIFGQRYDSSGQAQGTEFQVNSFTLSYQANPAVASDAGGNFVVVWQSRYQDGNSEGVFGQRYDNQGGALGAEFQVNSYTTSFQNRPGVASDAAGNFVVVWGGFGHYGFYSDIFGQRYDSQGRTLGTEFAITSGFRFELNPSVAMDPDSNFVVVWENDYYNRYGGFGVFGKRYDSSGTPVGGEFRINSYTTDTQRLPSVATKGTNQFVVAWQSEGQDGDMEGIFGQRFDFSGVPSVHVGDLDRRAKNVGASWRANVKTLVHVEDHSPINRTVVTLDVSGVGTRSCTATSDGICEVRVEVPDSVPSLTFTVTNLSKAGFSYDAGANHDPDPDSNGTTIVVNQP